MLKKYQSSIQIAVLTIFVFAINFWVKAQDLGGEASDGIDKVSVDWFQEIANGGMTIIALAALSVLGVMFTLERLFRLKEKRIAPYGLVNEVENLWQEGRLEEIESLCANKPSTLSRIITFVKNHRHQDLAKLEEGAGDIASRELRSNMQYIQPLSIVASLAPLLGLLGTMIGMIEAFQLVAIYGDEGGAAMLAGSISKALITTAVGLILAIPAMAVYHFFKIRTNHLFSKLEESIEVFFNHTDKFAVEPIEITEEEP